MFTRELQETLDRAFNEAINRRHEFLTLEHVLLALLQDRTARDVIRHCRGDVKKLQRELETFLEEKVEPLPDSADGIPEQTPAFQRVLQRATLQAQGSGQECKR